MQGLRCDLSVMVTMATAPWPASQKDLHGVALCLGRTRDRFQPPEGAAGSFEWSFQVMQEMEIYVSENRWVTYSP